MIFPELSYLACPYTHEDIAVRTERFQMANYVSAHFMKKGKMIFSPISHTHSIAVVAKLPYFWEFWREFDIAYLKASKELLVMQLPGWEKSVGVRAEIELAYDFMIPVLYIPYDEITQIIEREKNGGGSHTSPEESADSPRPAA